MGAAATIWSTLFTGCLGGRVEHVQAVASAMGQHQAALVAAAGSQAGSDGAVYGCEGGWVNGDVSSFFGLLALATPVIMLFGKFP
jgi:hypothetical protein